MIPLNILGTENDNRIFVIIHNVKGQLANLLKFSKGLDVNILSLVIEDVKVMSYYRVIMTVEGKDIELFKEKINKRFRID